MDANRAKEALTDLLRPKLRAPLMVSLGYEDSNGVRTLRVDSDETDERGLYWVHELPGRHPFVGRAYLIPGIIPDKILRYGLPVSIEQDAMGDYQITGVVARLASEFLEGVALDQVVYTPLESFLPGLLTETAPRTMKCRVMASWYTYGNSVKYIETQETADFSASPTDILGATISLPTTNGQARYIAVLVNWATGALAYKQGSLVSASLAHYLVYSQLDLGTGTYLPQPESGYFLAGYVQLLYGQTVLRRGVNIWAAQQLLANAFSNIPPVLTVAFSVGANTQYVIARCEIGDGGTLEIDPTGYVDFV